MVVRNKIIVVLNFSAAILPFIGPVGAATESKAKPNLVYQSGSLFGITPNCFENFYTRSSS